MGSTDPLRVVPMTVQEQTVMKLREAILTGVFRPGVRLVESDLCERMGVSRTSVREALRRLEAERLVTIVPNKGPSVTEISWKEAHEIYEVRALLEGEAAALFAQTVTPSGLAELEQALDAFDRADAEDDALGRVMATSRFYKIIVDGCGNRIMGELLDGLIARIEFLRARSMSQAGRGRKSAKEMREMLVTIGRRDASGARKAAVNHVKAACSAAEQVYSQIARPD